MNVSHNDYVRPSKTAPSNGWSNPTAIFGYMHKEGTPVANGHVITQQTLTQNNCTKLSSKILKYNILIKFLTIMMF